jgi:hypothetical protein
MDPQIWGITTGFLRDPINLGYAWIFHCYNKFVLFLTFLGGFL